MEPTTLEIIRGYFEDILQRSGSEVTAAELNSYVAAVDSGALTLAQARAALIASPEGEAVQDVVRLYQVVFGRVPDQGGLNFQVDALRQQNVAIQDVANGFAASDEFEARFGGNTVNTAFINAVYQQTLGRTPAASEVQFYLDSGFSAGRIALAFAESPEFVGNTQDAVEEFLDSAAQGTQDYEGSLGGGAGGGLPGDTFTLTVDVDNLVGTTGNDTFQGIVSATSANTLNTFDAIDGGNGVDTLNLAVRGGALNGPFNISNVEIVNLVSTPVAGGSSAPVLANLDASVFGEELEQLWQVNNAADVSGLTSGQAAGFRNTAVGTFDVTYDAAATVANIAFDEAASGTRVNVEGAGLTTLNISGSLVEPTGADAVLNFGGGESDGPANSLDALRTINIELSSNTEIGVFTDALNDVTTINASASTGDLDLDFSGLTGSELDLTSLSTGSGADDVSINLDSFDSTAATINLGAGNDVITIGAVETGSAAADLTALTLTLGAGRDTVVIGGELANVVAFSAADNTVTQSAIIVSDFNASEDLLDLSNTGVTSFFATQNTVDTAVANVVTAGGSLADVLAAVDDYSDATTAVRFNFGGNTYVYVDNSGGDTGAGDGLIQLTGVVALGATNVQFDTAP